MKIRWRVLGAGWNEIETQAKTIKELMEELKLSSEEYVATIKNRIVTEDHGIEEGDEITFVPVVSGG